MPVGWLLSSYYNLNLKKKISIKYILQYPRFYLLSKLNVIIGSESSLSGGQKTRCFTLFLLMNEMPWTVLNSIHAPLINNYYSTSETVSRYFSEAAISAGELFRLDKSRL